MLVNALREPPRSFKDRYRLAPGDVYRCGSRKALTSILHKPPLRFFRSFRPFLVRFSCSHFHKAISIKEYTNLLVFIVQLLRCNNSYIVHDAPAARLESERKSCAIRYIL
ncbi:MAG: hypothetical protein BECKG1743E_GA0114224_107721, partial [Candidatus Kentron sp. G]